MKKTKISFHAIAIRYAKENGKKLKHGGWRELTPLLAKISGIPVLPGLGSKKNGIAILKRLGLENHKTQKTKKNTRPKPKQDVNSTAFLESYAWRKLRMEVLKKHGARCLCCGATRRDGVQIHVDHIKPRRKHPELALDINNLQVLCGSCNHGKGNWDETDWRDPLTREFNAAMNGG